MKPKGRQAIVMDMDVPTTAVATADLAGLLADHFAIMPPVAALQLRVQSVEPQRVVLAAPLAANLNDKGCAFGGSLVSAMTLACWGLVTSALAREGIDADVFVADSHVRYLRPVFEDLRVEATFADADAVPVMLAAMDRVGRASVDLCARVRLAAGGRAASFQGRYVAIAKG